MNNTAVKWIVLGVLGAAFVFLFRSDISGFIRRITGIDVDIAKRHIIVAATPIGQTTVSVQTSPEAQYVDAKAQSNVYVDKHYRFSISWPINSGWIPSNTRSKDQLAALTGYVGPIEDLGTFFVTKTPGVGLVSVYVNPKQFDNIQAAVDWYVTTITRRGVTISSSTIDQDTGGAVLVTTSGTVSGVNRLLLGDKYQYVIAMTSVPSSHTSADEYEQIRIDTNMIFNSFRVLNQ